MNRLLLSISLIAFLLILPGTVYAAGNGTWFADRVIVSSNDDNPRLVAHSTNDNFNPMLIFIDGNETLSAFFDSILEIFTIVNDDDETLFSLDMDGNMEIPGEIVANNTNIMQEIGEIQTFVGVGGSNLNPTTERLDTLELVTGVQLNNTSHENRLNFTEFMIEYLNPTDICMDGRDNDIDGMVDEYDGDYVPFTTFDDCSLVGTEHYLRGTDIHGSTFVNTDLAGVTFENVTINDTDFVDAVNPSVTFSEGSDVSNCVFTDSPNSVSIVDSDGSGCDFSGSTLNSIYFDNSIVSGVDISNVNVGSITISGSDITNTSFTGLNVGNALSISNSDVTGGTFTTVIVGTHVLLDNISSSTPVDFSNADIGRSLFINNVNSNLDFSGINIGTSMAIVNSNIEGSDFTDLNVNEELDILDSNLSSVIFADIETSRIILTNTELTDVIISNPNTSNIEIVNASSSNTTKLLNLSLSGFLNINANNLDILIDDLDANSFFLSTSDFSINNIDIQNVLISNDFVIDSSTTSNDVLNISNMTVFDEFSIQRLTTDSFVIEGVSASMSGSGVLRNLSAINGGEISNSIFSLFAFGNWNNVHATNMTLVGSTIYDGGFVNSSITNSYLGGTTFFGGATDSIFSNTDFGRSTMDLGNWHNIDFSFSDFTDVLILPGTTFTGFINSTGVIGCPGLSFCP